MEELVIQSRHELPGFVMIIVGIEPLPMGMKVWLNLSISNAIYHAGYCDIVNTKYTLYPIFRKTILLAIQRKRLQ